MIYGIVGASYYEDVGCVYEDDYEFMDFDGTTRAASWQPVLVERYASDAIDGGNQPADMYCWPGCDAIVLRPRALIALRDILADGAEILPLATNDGVRLSLLNVTRVLNALDVERSELWRYPHNGEIGDIPAPAFHEPMVRGVHFFKLPRYTYEVFVGEPFVKRVRAAGLQGLDFQLVWSPASGPVRRTLW